MPRMASFYCLALATKLSGERAIAANCQGKELLPLCDTGWDYKTVRRKSDHRSLALDGIIKSSGERVITAP